jgi:hypothetical protein
MAHRVLVCLPPPYAEVYILHNCDTLRLTWSHFNFTLDFTRVSPGFLQMSFFSDHPAGHKLNVTFSERQVLVLGRN